MPYTKEHITARLCIEEESSKDKKRRIKKYSRFYTGLDKDETFHSEKPKSFRQHFRLKPK
jgi:hypothetical protein